MAREQARVKKKELEGDLGKAYRRACEMLQRAEERGDDRMTLAASRHVARLLALKQKAAGPAKQEFSITTGPARFGRDTRVAVLWPAPYESRSAGLGEIARADVILRIDWQDAPIRNPWALLNEDSRPTFQELRKGHDVPTDDAGAAAVPMPACASEQAPEP